MPDSGDTHPAAWSFPVAPVVFVVGLLVLATSFQGAFALRSWAPPAIFVLVLLAVTIAGGGGASIASRPLAVALWMAWALAAWALLSMTWAQSPAEAWEGASRLMLYAGVLTVPAVILPGRRSLELAGAGVVAGIAVIGIVTLVDLLTRGGHEFLAGRLDSPVGYRNATACLFGMAVWPMVCTTAGRGRSRVLRAVAFAAAVLCLGLAFLTQSRGILIGLALGGAVAVLLGPDRVRRAWTMLLAVAFLAVGASGLLRPYHAFDGGKGIVRSADVTHAGKVLLALVVVAFVVALVLAVFDEGLRPHEGGMTTVRRLARVTLVGAIVVGVAGGLVAIGNPATYARQKWDEFRSDQTVTPSSTRLLTTSGQRYDLWRVALKELKAQPLHGVGESNYSFDYYRERSTNRNLDNPHSTLFGVAAELGVVGLLLLALWIGAMVAAVAGGWRATPWEVQRNATGLIAAGAVLLGQMAVDWLDLIPGVTALGLFALAVGVTQIARQGADATVAGRGPLPLRVALGAGLAVLAVGIGALFLSDAYVRKARADINKSPAARLSSARTAAKFDPLSVTPHYLEAGALEDMGQIAAAREQLLKAYDLEPRNVATLGLLGDFAARRGHRAAARRWYRRALALDPLDVGIQQLAKAGGNAPPASG